MEKIKNLNYKWKPKLIEIKEKEERKMYTKQKKL